jgi:hypothetical protein
MPGRGRREPAKHLPSHSSGNTNPVASLGMDPGPIWISPRLLGVPRLFPMNNKQLYLLCAVILFAVSNIFQPALLFGLALFFLTLFLFTET